MSLYVQVEVTSGFVHVQVEVKHPSLAVVRFKPGALETILHGNATFNFLGDPLTLHQAYLVWLQPQNVSALTSSEVLGY